MVTWLLVISGLFALVSGVVALVKLRQGLRLDGEELTTDQLGKTKVAAILTVLIGVGCLIGVPFTTGNGQPKPRELVLEWEFSDNLSIGQRDQIKNVLLEFEKRCLGVASYSNAVLSASVRHIDTDNLNTNGG